MGTKLPFMSTHAASLSEALFTRTQSRVLGLLFGQPDRSFYLLEIVRAAGVGRGSVQRELERLTSAGLIDKRRVGNQVHYQANRNSMVFEELRGLVVKTVGVADVIRTALIPESDTIESAFIYGSIAKNEDHTGSDIDLMVVSDSLEYAQLLSQLAGCEEKLGRAINPIIYTREQFEQKRKETRFLQRVMEQPRIQLIGKDAEHEKTRQS